MTKYLVTALAALSAVNSVSASGAVELTQSNFKDSVAGKNAFVKFLAPWYVNESARSSVRLLPSCDNKGASSHRSILRFLLFLAQ